uniref:Uncharacterized protein n=1 Tax=Panstrongylus lignarius TaxID=156445 RepID=A0A224XQY1_9HEMI
MPVTAYLVAVYGAIFAAAVNAAAEAIATICPPPLSIMLGKNARIVQKCAITLTFIILSICSSLTSIISAELTMPALFINTSTGLTNFTNSTTCLRSVISHKCASAHCDFISLHNFAVSSAPANITSIHVIKHPSLANRRQISRPSPRAAPVTRTCFPANDFNLVRINNSIISLTT